MYDIWEQRLLFARNYMNIDVLDDGKLRMQIDYDCFDYYDCWKDVFIEEGIE